MTTFDLLRPQDWARLAEFLSEMADTKAKLTVTVKPYRKRRSTNANAYYWSVIIPALSNHFGYSTNEMHIVLLGMYTGWEQRNFRGTTVYLPRRTSTHPDVMDTMDFQGLIQTAQQIAAEEGITLPDQDHAEETKETQTH